MRKQIFNGLIAIALLVLVVMCGSPAFAESINYTYDDLNRLTRADYGNGFKIEYTYDEAGNAVEKRYIDANDTTAPVTTAAPAGGAYNAAQTITLTCTDAACYKIFYTTDGTTPTTASAVYSAPISIAATATLQYFAVDVAGNNEAVKTQTYTIDTAPPVTTASPAGGTYNASQSVTLTCTDADSACGTIYYTTDGTTPTTASAVYTAPVSIVATVTVQYFAVDVAGNSETVKTQAYIVLP